MLNNRRYRCIADVYQYWILLITQGVSSLDKSVSQEIQAPIMQIYDIAPYACH